MSDLGTNLKDRLVFRRRTITTIIGLPVVAALVWFDTPIPWFTLLAVGWGVGAVNEFYGIVKRSKGLHPLSYFGMLWTLLFIISPHFDLIPHLDNAKPAYLLLATAVIIPLVILLWRQGKENAFANWTWTIAGILYIGWLLSYFVALRNLNDGRGWVFLAILCTFASDISAYVVGRSLGRHKLAPYVSPNKTWEGAIGGGVGAVILSVVVVMLFHLPVTWWGSIILGVYYPGNTDQLYWPIR
jgi:phosphatidate cytidylyltransferase